MPFKVAKKANENSSAFGVYSGKQKVYKFDQL